MNHYECTQQPLLTIRQWVQMIKHDELAMNESLISNNEVAATILKHCDSYRNSWSSPAITIIRWWFTHYWLTLSNHSWSMVESLPAEPIASVPLCPTMKQPLSMLRWNRCFVDETFAIIDHYQPTRIMNYEFLNHYEFLIISWCLVALINQRFIRTIP